MSRVFESPKDLSVRTMTRTQSFELVMTDEMLATMSPTAEGSEKLSKKKQSDRKNETRDQPRGTKLGRVQDTSNMHKKIAESLFTSTQSGLQIFRHHNNPPQNNILTSLGVKDVSIFHQILDHMQLLVQYEDNIDLIRTIPPVAKEFLEHLTIKHHGLLDQPDSTHSRPLDAAASKLKPVVFLVADLVLSEDTLKYLPAKTCPAKSKTGPKETCSFDIPSSLQSAFRRDSKNGETLSPKACVHDIVDVEELERWSVNMKKTMSGVLQPQKTENQWGNPGTILHTLLDEESFAKVGGIAKISSFERLIELCSEATLKSVDQKGHCPLHKAILLYDKDGVDFDRLYGVIESLVRKFPKSIYLEIRSPEGVTTGPYSLLQTVKPRKKDVFSEAFDESIRSWSKAEKLLKHTCIGDDDERDSKMTYLYGDIKQAKNIYLDMAFPNPIDDELITRLSDTVNWRLDTALEYVSLRHDLPKTASHELSPPSSIPTAREGRGRNPCQSVFEWLQKEWKVEKIFKVVVEDLLPFPHTDEAIKTALKPFKVEVWDWRKLDISSQAIFEAAKETRELHLQCSGNEAVLRSWACKHGLAQLTELRSVTVTMHLNLRETKDECQKYFDNFKSALNRRRPDIKKTAITVKWAGEPTDQKEEAGDIESSQGIHQSDQLAWVKTMKPFVKFLDEYVRGTMEDPDSASVRIALIDNGVNSMVKDIPRLEYGKSFHGERHKDIPFRDYFTGPSRHGTQMASCIYKVCPMAKLYPVRMDDSKLTVEKFTVDSAIKAVNWATRMGVDIISMSWTFKKDDAGPGQIDEFREAIRKAYSAGIILLSSLDDTGTTDFGELFPLSFDEVIRIGSATKWGEKSPSTKQGQAAYLFPGQEVAIPSDDRDGEVFIHGSSVATAFAAGLAGVLIYAARALLYLDGENLSDSEKQKLDSINTRAKIDQVFKVLGGKPNETLVKDLYVGLGRHFPTDPDKEALEGRKEDVLKSFLTKVLVL